MDLVAPATELCRATQFSIDRLGNLPYDKDQKVSKLAKDLRPRDDRGPGNDGPGMVSNMASGLASSGLMMATTKFFGQAIPDLRN